MNFEISVTIIFLAKKYTPTICEGHEFVFKNHMGLKEVVFVQLEKPVGVNKPHTSIAVLFVMFAFIFSAILSST